MFLHFYIPNLLFAERPQHCELVRYACIVLNSYCISNCITVSFEFTFIYIYGMQECGIIVRKYTYMSYMCVKRIKLCHSIILCNLYYTCIVHALLYRYLLVENIFPHLYIRLIIESKFSNIFLYLYILFFYKNKTNIFIEIKLSKLRTPCQY